jgi:hypothetical protein
MKKKQERLMQAGYIKYQISGTKKGTRKGE